MSNPFQERFVVDFNEHLADNNTRPGDEPITDWDKGVLWTLNQLSEFSANYPPFDLNAMTAVVTEYEKTYAEQRTELNAVRKTLAALRDALLTPQQQMVGDRVDLVENARALMKKLRELEEQIYPELVSPRCAWRYTKDGQCSDHVSDKDTDYCPRHEDRRIAHFGTAEARSITYMPCTTTWEPGTPVIGEATTPPGSVIQEPKPRLITGSFQKILDTDCEIVSIRDDRDDHTSYLRRRTVRLLPKPAKELFRTLSDINEQWWGQRA